MTDPNALYPRDTLFTVTATAVSTNATTGADDTTPSTGRTDGHLWLSRTAGGAAIPTLEADLSEIGTTGIYTATLDGSVLAAALGSLPAGATVWRCVRFGTDSAPQCKAVPWFPVLIEA